MSSEGCSPWFETWRKSRNDKINKESLRKSYVNTTNKLEPHQWLLHLHWSSLNSRKHGRRDRWCQVLHWQGKQTENSKTHKKPLTATKCWLVGLPSFKWLRAPGVTRERFTGEIWGWRTGETARDTVKEKERSKDRERQSDRATVSTNLKKRDVVGQACLRAWEPTAEGLMMPGLTQRLFTKRHTAVLTIAVFPRHAGGHATADGDLRSRGSMKAMKRLKDRHFVVCLY